MKIVLVTGGTGFIGRHLQKLKSEWIYVSSDDYSLTNINETRQMYEDIRPDAVIHLAARVGGIKDNAENQVEYLEQKTYFMALRQKLTFLMVIQKGFCTFWSLPIGNSIK